MSWDLDKAHKHSSEHREEIQASKACGCFYCMRVFPSSEIVEWVSGGQTALCPHCPVDAVLGDASGYPVGDADFLSAMHVRWFDQKVKLTRSELKARLDASKRGHP